MKNARWITPDETVAAWENDDGTESSGLPPSGLPVASFDHEPLRSRLVEQVKGECRRRIERRYPAFRQLNLIREGDTAELGAWVAAHLDACDAHEATIAAADRAAVLAYDVTAGWPDAVGDAVRVRDDSAGDLSGNDESVRPVDLVEDEDPGEQPEIFTEEDVEALDEASAQEVAPPTDHGGVLVQFDDLGKLRNDVIAAITFQEIVRARPLENDTNRWDELRDLRGLAADAGKSMDPMTEAQWDRLNELERTFHGRLNEIKRHASMLRDRAFDASPEMLAAMAEDIWNGGP